MYASEWSDLEFLQRKALSRESDRMIECFLEMQHNEKPTEGGSL